MTHPTSPDIPPPLPFASTLEDVTSIRWLLTNRWLAGGGVLAATWFACYILDLGVPAIPLLLTGLIILAYNGLLWLWFGRISREQEDHGQAYSRLAHVQVWLDWLAMSLLIHFSGGVESPLIFFFTFHIIIASLLFRQRIAYLYAVTALVLVGGIVALEGANWLPHVHVKGFLDGDPYRNSAFIIAILGTFALVNLVAVYLASSIVKRLHNREEQLSTLYLGAQTINSTLDLTEVLERLAEATARAMNVSGVSIGLLDPTGTRVDLAAAYGLDAVFLAKGPILLEKGRVHTDVLSSGQPGIVQKREDKARLQYPDEMEAAGLRSALYVRLQAKHRSLGVVRAYSRQSDRFDQDDARFLSAIAAQGAAAIENAMAFQALKKLDLDKSQFVRAVTHELRSPVTGAQSLLRGVLKGYAGELGERQRDIMGRLNRRLDKLEALINDLLDLATGRSDLKVEEAKPLPLIIALEHVIRYYEAVAAAKEQSLTFDHPEGNPIVMATEEGLERIFVNLVGNGIKYTPEGGTVRISVQEEQLQVAVAISDTGIGIPADSLSRLFSEFYRAPNAKAFETGTGLGLVIVKELVESFGGRISVESQEGKGTTFTVHLPLITA